MHIRDHRLPCFSVILVRILPVLVACNLWSQAPVIVPGLSGTIELDGVPDEAAWQAIQPLPVVMHSPVFGLAPTETTVFRITYDKQYFYLSGVFDFKVPHDIRAIGKKRDYSMPTCDWFGIILDSFYDRENALAFWTNPNGTRTDASVKNDAILDDSDINFSWNTFWDVKTKINDHGWSAEFRIPFSSLRYQTTNGKTVMGLSLIRYIPAKSEMMTFPAISPDYSNAFWKPSLTTGITFSGLEPKKPVYITPYVTVGIGQSWELNEAETAYDMNPTPKYDAGIDAKYSITNNLTMDLTVNTDFAQVEADDQKINLTRYSLYFPEKRVFFLEKSDVFDFPIVSGSGNNLFYSRRIGLYDGNPVRIYGGLRMTGRINKWDVGILDMQTASYEENPGENFGVVRAKRSLQNPNSYTGAIVTSRLGMNGNYNVAYGLDGQFRVTGDEFLTLKWAQTFENDSANKLFDMSPSRFLVEWQRRKVTGFGYHFLYTWSGKQFNPGIGFEAKDNFQLGKMILQYGWLPAETFLHYHKVSILAYDLWNTATGLHETDNIILTWYFEAKKGYWGGVDANWFLEDIADTLSLGNDQASVPPGRYSFAYLSPQFSTSNAYALSLNTSAEIGGFYDGWKLSLYINPQANIGSGIELGLTYYFDYVNFPERSMQFTNHIPGFRGLMTLSTKTSLLAFIQYNTAVDKVIANIRFRYNPREGNDFYIVYDEGINTHTDRETPVLPFSSGRTILLKYTYTFRL
jgi:hypothetical protein